MDAWLCDRFTHSAALLIIQCHPNLSNLSNQSIPIHNNIPYKFSDASCPHLFSSPPLQSPLLHLILPLSCRSWTVCTADSANNHRLLTLYRNTFPLKPSFTSTPSLFITSERGTETTRVPCPKVSAHSFFVRLKGGGIAIHPSLPSRDTNSTFNA